jgi:hypothetical protein
MVPVEKLPDEGFRSVYEFTADAARTIRASGNSKGMDKYAVHSDTLFIDLDDGDKSLKLAMDWVVSTGAAFDVYSSGGKGYHFHVKIDGMDGLSVPRSQEVYASKLPFPTDLSLYRSGSLFALPGRRHRKTGKRKALVERIEGGFLKIPAVAPKPMLDFSGLDGGISPVLSALKCAELLLTNPPINGQRHNRLWQFGLRCMEAGLSSSAAVQLADLANDTWAEPKEEDELIRAVTGGYK